MLAMLPKFSIGLFMPKRLANEANDGVAAAAVLAAELVVADVDDDVPAELEADVAADEVLGEAAATASSISFIEG